MFTSRFGSSPVRLLRSVLGLIIVAAVYGGRYWVGSSHRAQNDRSANVLAPYQNSNGFVELPPVKGQNPDTVYVVAAVNCPKVDAQRADQLTRSLRGKKIPVMRTAEADFRFSGPDRQTVEKMNARVNAIMTGPLPIVFVHGRAKANPSFAEIVAEYEMED